MYIANYIINFGTCRTRGMSAPAGFFLTTRAYETKSCSRTAACRSCASPWSPAARASSLATGSSVWRLFLPLRLPHC